MAAKKVDTTEPMKNTVDDFKQNIIDVGIKLCEEIKSGHSRSNEDNLTAIIGLYNAIK